MQKKLIEQVFRWGKSMAQAKRDVKNAPSYFTIRKIIHQESERREQGKYQPTPPQRKSGRPPALSEEDREVIFNLVNEHRARGTPFTSRADILKEVGFQVKRHHGDEGVYPQRVSDLKQDLGLSYKKGRARKILPKVINQQAWLEKQKRVPRIDRHWFDEKPLWSNAVPGKSWGTRSRHNSHRKALGTVNRYSILTMCNIKYGVKLIDIIKHDKGVGVNRATFLEECATKILPILKEHQNEWKRKRQVLYLDCSNIHIDKKNHQFEALFGDVEDIRYLPKYPEDHNNPLDHSIFGTFQKLFEKHLNSTEEEVRGSVKDVVKDLTPDMVLAAIKDMVTE